MFDIEKSVDLEAMRRYRSRRGNALQAQTELREEATQRGFKLCGNELLGQRLRKVRVASRSIHTLDMPGFRYLVTEFRD